MMRSLVVLSIFTFSIFGFVAGCGESSGEAREPVDVTVDTFNVALAGAFIPFEAARRPYISEAIAASDADILCLQEVWDQTDKVAIQDAAAAAFPHSAFFEDDLDTPVEDATDQQGQVPPAPTTVPCPADVEAEEGVTVADEMDDAIDCLKANCSTIPDSEDGRTISEACASSECGESVAPLIFGDPQEQRCYSCIVTQLPTETFGDMRSRCPTVVNQDLAFQGQNGVMILSRHPLKNVEELVIPGTWNRRTILSATVELPTGAELDTYCNHLTPIFTGLFFPYTGQYVGWQEEQELQAEKLINYVTQTGDNRPAVILGDLNAGHAYPAQEIVAEGEATLDLLELVFEPAYTTDYAPLCTFCSTNPVTNPENDPDETSVWIDHILLDKLPAASVVSSERVYDEDVVPVGNQTVPLSDHFGMRSVITVP
jgi:endonuclease/exonuclease/phosphatase family metal-dependent hydrolase